MSNESQYGNYILTDGQAVYGVFSSQEQAMLGKTTLTQKGCRSWLGEVYHKYALSRAASQFEPEDFRAQMSQIEDREKEAKKRNEALYKELSNPAVVIVYQNPS